MSERYPYTVCPRCGTGGYRHPDNCEVCLHAELTAARARIERLERVRVAAERAIPIMEAASRVIEYADLPPGWHERRYLARDGLLVNARALRDALADAEANNG